MTRQHTAAEPAERRELRSFARGGIVSLAGSVLSAATGFLLTVVVARLLGAAQAGVFFIVVAIFTILSEITELGADEGMVRGSAQLVALGRGGELRRLTRVALGPVLSISAVTAVALYVLAPRIAEVFAEPQYLDEAVLFLRIAAPFLAISAARAVILAGTRGLGSIIGYTITNTAMPASRPVLAVAVVALGFGSGAVMLSWAVPIGATFVAGAILFWLQVRRAETVSGGVPAAAAGTAGPVSSAARDFWMFSGARGVAAIIEIALVWLDVLLVGAMVSNDQAGIYATASRFITSGTLVLSATRIAVAPQIAGLLARGENRTAEELYNVATSWVIAASWPIYLVLACFGPVILMPFGAEFTEGAAALAILSCSMLVLMAAGNVQTVLLMGGRSSWTLANKVVALIVNIALNLLLVPPFGIVGAAVAWGASITIDTAAASFQVHRYLGLRLRPRRLAVPGLWALVCFGAGGLLIRLLFGASPATFALYVLVACLGYGIALWRARSSLHADLLLEAVRSRRT